jgi:transcriptional regulator of acetoin/glycerol metabolism
MKKLKTLQEAKDIVEKQMLIKALKSQNNNIAKTVKVLGVSRPCVYNLKKKHGV